MGFGATAKAQVLSLNIDDGYIGTIGSNSGQANNIKTFTTLGISSANLYQNDVSGNGSWSLQGNDLLANLRLNLTAGGFIDFPVSVTWRETSSGKIIVMGVVVLPTSSASTIASIGSFNIISGSTTGTSSNIGLLFPGATETFTDGSNRSGNAANVSSWLSTIQSAYNTQVLNDLTPPTISNQTFSYSENQLSGAVLGTLIYSDNVGVSQIQHTEALGTSYFNISNVGDITLTPAGLAAASNDYETSPNSFTATVTLRDGKGNTSSATITLNVTDGPDSGFTVSKTTATVSESGTTDTFTVVLDAAPSSNVVFNITSSDTGEATVSSPLTFTTSNWSTAQTVTITGVDDSLMDGTISSTVTVSVDDANSDNAFDPLADQTVTVSTTDNDTSTPPPAPDRDGDGVSDANDNCPDAPNADQSDTDGDGIGDACDTDDDGDGVPDVQDNFPLDPNEDTDTDGDGIGNNADTDDDNDGAEDSVDPNPYTPTAKDDDKLETPLNGPSEVLILGNDDYVEGLDNKLNQTGGTAGGEVTFDEKAGIMFYTPLIEEAGKTVTVIYQVCYNGVCASATVTFTIEIDTDGDGLGDSTDSDDDGDGTEDSIDPNPSQPTAEPDAASPVLNGPTVVDLLANDDYVSGLDITLTMVGGTARGEVIFDVLDGTMSYTPLPEEAGTTVTVIYQVCYKGVCAMATITLSIEPDADADGIGDSADPDDDNDGVEDIYDNCPGTPAGTQVDINGCSLTELDANDFSVGVTSASCTNLNDGALALTATDTRYNYQVTVSGQTPFTLNTTSGYTKTLTGLGAGSYTVCFTAEGLTDATYCYTVVITQPEALSVDTQLIEGTQQLKLSLQGAAQYTVELNGQVTTYDKASTTLNLKTGLNRLRIYSDSECQGMIEQEVFVSEVLEYAPNPVLSYMDLFISGSDREVELTLSNLSGGVIWRSTVTVPASRIYRVDMNRHAQGTYILQAQGQTALKTIKVIKR